MDIEIKIGRDVEGTSAFRVPDAYKMVSRHHAVFHWHDGIATLEDNGSSNGTFVNGRRIATCKVNENDTVLLGGNDNMCYRLDLRQLFATCRGSGNQPSYSQQPSYPRQNVGMNNGSPVNGNTHGNDYSREFAQVKQVYIDYHDAMSKLTKKANTSMQLPRVLLSMIPALLGIVIMFVSRDMTMRIVAMSAGSILSGLIGTLTMGRGNSKKEKMQEDIMDLQLKYKKEYRCPKCGKEFSLDMHWKKLLADETCPYGCGAQYNS